MEQSYWLRAINWTHGVPMRVPDQKVTNGGSTSMAPFFWRKSNWFRPTKKIKLKRSSKEREFMIWRTKLQAMVQGRVQLKRFNFACLK
jgi:hypothetical protein